MYAVGDICPTCKKGKLALAPPETEAQFVCDNCGTTHANAPGMMGVGVVTVKLKVRSGEKVRGKSTREIDHEERGHSSVRYSRVRDEAETKVIQVAWTPDHRLKHLECKTKGCGNEWYLADKKSYKAEFQVEGSIVTCKKCGAKVSII